MNTNNKRTPKLFSLLLTVCMVSSLLPVYASANSETDYSTPVPMLPVETTDISAYDPSMSFEIEGDNGTYSVQDNTIHYTGKRLTLGGELIKDGFCLPSGQFYTMEFEGNNVRKELVEEGHPEELYFDDILSQAVFGFALRMDHFNRRAGLKPNNLELFDIFLGMQSFYTLDQLKQYSCAREFLDKTGFYKSDKQVEAGPQGYISQWEDTITPRATGLGYATPEAYMDDLVEEGGYDGWRINDGKEYASYTVIKKSAVDKDVLEKWALEDHNFPVFEKGDEYYVRAVCFVTPPTGSYASYAYQLRWMISNDLNIDDADMRIETREDSRKNYQLYCNSTYTQIIEAWAQEMDTWWGHWDYLLNGTTNFDYWPDSDFTMSAGYEHHNYGSLGCICGAVPVDVDPVYNYYVEGPGDITVRLTGKNVNYTNRNATFNIVGTQEFVIHVVDDTTPTIPDPTAPEVTEPEIRPTEPEVTEPETQPAEPETTEPHVHAFGEWVVTKKPTASAEGEETRTCACGAKETRAIARLSNPFVDIASKDYFFEPVLWAVNNGITSGVSANRFGPHEACTRGQIVTFLWAAAGRPEPETTENPFKDISSSDYYYKAVLWAVENGITAGVSADRFGPNQTCTRAHAVTFLWASFGRPSAEKAASFSDVTSSDYFCNAVNWAVENGVTSGVGNNRFGPHETCVRAQIVTFLYQAFK